MTLEAMQATDTYNFRTAGSNSASSPSTLHQLKQQDLTPAASAHATFNLLCHSLSMPPRAPSGKVVLKDPLLLPVPGILPCAASSGSGRPCCSSVPPCCSCCRSCCCPCPAPALRVTAGCCSQDCCRRSAHTMHTAPHPNSAAAAPAGEQLNHPQAVLMSVTTALISASALAMPPSELPLC
jgi:hypothetical protein